MMITMKIFGLYWQIYKEIEMKMTHYGEEFF